MFSSQATTSLVLLFLSVLTPTNAQQVPDGAIVPFTSQLPACASKCGPLYDVQGGCTTGDTNACFCADTRLTTITTGGTAAVSTICGPGSCTAQADLDKVATWYKSFCGKSTTGPTTTAGVQPTTTAPTGSTGTAGGSGSNAGQGFTPPVHGSWISTHYQWVIMLIIVIFLIVGGWIGACIWRRSYLRKKERQFEMRPPAVPWIPTGPELHTAGSHDKGKGLQSVYGPGVGMNDSASGGGHLKEMRGAVNAPAPPGADPEKGGKRGWLKKKNRG